MMQDIDALKTYITDQLKRVQRENYPSERAMAQDLGVSQSKLSRIMNQETKSIDKYFEVASQVAETLDLSLDKLTNPRPKQEEQGEVVRMYDDVTVGAGNGLKPMNAWNYRELGMPRHILRKLLGTTSVPRQVGIVEVQGESMYPEIRSGDFIMFTPEDRIADGGTYVIRLDDALLVKVLQRKAGRRIRIHSLNSEFSDDMIRQTETGLWVTDDEAEHTVDFDVVGRFLNVIQEKDLFRGAQRVHDALHAYQAIESNGQ